MWYKKKVLFISLFLLLYMTLVGLGQIVLAGVVAFAGIGFLVSRRYYFWAGVTSVVVVTNFYIFTWVRKELAFFLAVLLFYVLFFGSRGLHVYQIRKNLKEVLEEKGMNYFSLKILSDNVDKYYEDLYQVKNPVFVKVTAGDTVLKGYFDVKTKTFVVDEPKEFPVYTSTPIPVWGTVVEIHSNGAPRRVEFKDEDENLVRVEVYDERGSLVAGSERLRNGSYEKWNTVKAEWEAADQEY